MRIEATFGESELVELINGLLPLTIRLGAQTEAKWMHIHEPRGVGLVADEGLRMVCSAKIRWPLPLVTAPLVMNAIHLLFRPRLVRRDGRDQLFFQIRLEHADIRLAPNFIDRSIVKIVNEELDERRIGLSWDFMRTLDRSFRLPKRLEQIDEVRIAPTAGSVEIGREHIKLGIALQPTVNRGTRSSSP